MKYEVIIYNTPSDFSNSLFIRSIEESHNKSMDAYCEYLERFNGYDIEKAIDAELHGKCRVITTRNDRKAPDCWFITVLTSYAVAPEVLPRLHSIATRNGLWLYDAETKKSYSENPVKRSFISYKIRENALRKIIRERVDRIYNLCCIDQHFTDRENEGVFVLTLRKMSGVHLTKRIEQFYQILNESISSDEKVVCDNKCFTVEGDGYRISYIVEAYGKRSQFVCFMNDNQICVENMHRMSSYLAVRWMKGRGSTDKNDISARMRFREMVGEYPNPADRFVASVNISKQQDREIFDIRYSGYGYYGSEILFHVIEPLDDNESISVLKIEEESASFILPYVEEFFPYIYQRYYDENHIPFESFIDILNRIKKIRDKLVNGECDPSLMEHLDKINLYVLVCGKNRKASMEESDMIRSQPEKFIYLHRYDIAHFYDIFIYWCERQADYYERFASMVNIQGP